MTGGEYIAGLRRRCGNVDRGNERKCLHRDVRVVSESRLATSAILGLFGEKFEDQRAELETSSVVK